MVTPVQPVAGVNSQIVSNNTAVIAVNPNPNGGFITNPYLASDQGISTAEVLYVNAVSTCGTAANGTTFALQPGQSWQIIPGQQTPTSVNANTAGHKFSVVVW